MKQKIAGILAAVLMITAAGCTKEQSRPYHKPTGATLEVTLEHAWRAEPLAIDSALRIDRMQTAGNDLLLTWYKVKGQPEGGIYDTETASLLELDSGQIPLGAAETGSGYRILWMASDGTEPVYTLTNYDSSWNAVSHETLDVPDISETLAYYYEDENGMLLTDQTGSIYACDADGRFRGELKGNVPGAKQIFKGNDGKLYTIAGFGDCFLGVLDTDNLTMEKYMPEDAPQSSLLLPGDDRYLCYSIGERNLYGIRADGSEILADWESSDLAGGAWSMQLSAVLPDGSFVISQPGDEMQNNLYRITPRSEEELAGMKLVTIAAYQTDDYLAEMVRRYNRQSKDVHFVIKSYLGKSDLTPEDWENGQAAFDTFKQELLQGIIPDVLCLNSVDYAALSNKGMFEDLRPWMEHDPDFQAEDYFSNFFEAMSYKGTLERMAFDYRVDALAAKAQFVTGDTGRIGNMTSLADSLPDGMTLFPAHISREAALHHLLSCGQFLDYENASCDFSSKDFVQLLELAGRQPSPVSALEDTTAWTEDRALLCPTSLSPGMLHQTAAGYFDGAPITLIGQPGGAQITPGCAFAVSVESFYKEEIWDFIKFSLREENQLALLNPQTLGTIPANRNALHTMWDRLIRQDEDAWLQFQYNVRIGNETRMLDNPTPEEEALLTAYLETITACTDDSVSDIITEESGKYFAGDTSAQEAADAIQSRVTIYLSERS